MALQPPAATGSDGASAPAEGADAATGQEEALDQQQRDGRAQAHKRRMAVENDAFAELAAMLPVRRPIKGFMDKLTVLRLAIAFMKVSRLYRRDVTQSARSQGCHQWESPEMLTNALSGFVFILDGNGWILYMSQSVSQHLGHCAAQMVGNNIRSYLHADDMAELAGVLRGPMRDLAARGDPCRLVLRLSNALRMRGPGAGRYSAVLCCGYRRLCQLTRSPIAEHNRANNILLLAAGHTLPNSYLPRCEFETESGTPLRSSLTLLGQRSFVFRSNMDLTPFYVEAAVRELTEYDTFTFSHYSLYHFVHPCDIETVRRSHKDVLAKGHCVTGYYRLMVRSGGWIWMQSYFTLVHVARAARNKFILSVNDAVSNTEHSSSEFNGVRYPNQCLLPRNRSEGMYRNKGRGLCCSDGTSHAKSPPKNATYTSNPDENANLPSVESPQNNGRKTALGYSCALSNLMKSLAAKEREKTEESNKYLLQSQPEANVTVNNDPTGRVSINTAGLSGGTVHHYVPVTPQKVVRRDYGRKLTRQLDPIAIPKDGTQKQFQQQPLKSLTLKFVSEATPFTEEDSNLVPDTNVLSGSGQFQSRAFSQSDNLTPVQNCSAVMDSYQQSQLRSSFEAPRLPTRENVNLWQVSEQSCWRSSAQMERGSEHALPSCHNSLQQSLVPAHSEIRYPLQAHDFSSVSTTNRASNSSLSSCCFQSGL